APDAPGSGRANIPSPHAVAAAAATVARASQPVERRLVSLSASDATTRPRVTPRGRGARAGRARRAVALAGTPPTHTTSRLRSRGAAAARGSPIHAAGTKPP